MLKDVDGFYDILISDEIYMMMILTLTIAVDMNGSAVHLSQSLDLKMITVNMTPPLPPHILIKVLCHIL